MKIRQKIITRKKKDNNVLNNRVYFCLLNQIIFSNDIY